MIYLFHGKNSFLSSLEFHRIQEQIVNSFEQDRRAVNVIKFDGSTSDPSVITTEIETPSMFSDTKVFMMKRVSESPEKDQLNEYLIKLLEDKDPNEILIWENNKVRSNTRLFKAFKKHGKIYEAPELNKRTFRTWAKQQLSTQEVNVDSNALDIFMQRVNYNPERFVKETEKLKLLPAKIITVEIIDKVCPDTLEHTIWELIDSINEQQNSKAATILNKLLNQGNDAYFILSMLGRNLRLLLLTKILQSENKTSGEISKILKIPPFSIYSVSRSAQNISLSKIKKIYDKIINIDYSAKTGQIDINLALNILLSII
ncbi:DNA polymerase III subunit delta [Candidatus Dojkabacteria bacterium]|nr:DNA polymerase III subunit delta [Candidatus Dojkabacteria bacterium]